MGHEPCDQLFWVWLRLTIEPPSPGFEYEIVADACWRESLERQLLIGAL